MPLKPGDRIGAYEIVGLLGHGAMGEVYRARDTRLGREVAVKVLPARFVDDPERLSRFEREARLIAQVHHPNICTLFDIFEDHDAPVLILELVEGETLQQRLFRGPMSLLEALRCASGIAAALEAAHGKNIIHRDLKPSNIAITKGGAIKVLDFGVAKLARDVQSQPDTPDLTLTLGGTKEGLLVGTVGYVSPEQAMGDRIDARCDIWAFGCLLFEMLTASRAFPGVAVADTLAAVMRGEPEWTLLPADTPPSLRTLLRRCLEKERSRRLANIADAQLEIEDLLVGRADAAPGMDRSARARRGRGIAVVAFVAGVVVATMIARLAVNRQPASDPPVGDVSATSPAPPASFESPPRDPSAAAAATLPSSGSTAGSAVAFIALPEGIRWAPAVDDGVPNTILAMSPDGRLLLLSARDDDGTALWLKSLVTNEVWRLPGTEDGVSPFWSPDGGSIGFFADRKLKRADLNGLGTRSRDASQLSVMTLCEVRTQRGGTWGPDNTIVFSPFSDGLRRISASGGPVTVLTTSKNEPAHVRPHFLAGTRYLLYRVTGNRGRSNPFYVTPLDGHGRKLIGTFDTGMVTYSRGHLLFTSNNFLMAQPFDLKALAITGPPRPIASGVLLSTGTPPVFGVFSASPAGRLVHLTQGGNFNDPATVLSNWTESPAPAARIPGSGTQP